MEKHVIENESNSFYSLHTFILPFVWKYEEAHIDFDQLQTYFREQNGWHLETPLENYRHGRDDFFERDRLFYNEYCYFYPQAQKAIYDNNEKIVRTYTYKPEKTGLDSAKYIIECVVDKKSLTYELQLNGVELKLYSTGIGFFALKCKNINYASVADVKNINEYGRRVVAPAISNDGTNFAADCLTLVIDEKEQYTCNIRGMIDSGNIRLNTLCTFVEDLLTASTGKRFTSSEKRGADDAVVIMRALDDRMFVYAFLKDREFVSDLCTKEGDQYHYQSPENITELYELIFADHQGGCSCRDDKMRRNLVENHLYKRWIDKYSLYSIAPQAIIFMTKDGDFIADHFNTMYYQMFCFVLAQRVSLITFQRELTEISRMTVDYKRTKSLLDLRERFSVFEASMYYEEITAQEQGIELYKMFRGCLSIEAEMENVKNQINGLSESADIFLDMSFNRIGVILAIIGAFYSSIEIMSGVLEGDAPYSTCHRLIFGILCVLLLLVCIGYIARIYLKKK